jgi:hypothetical protein
VDALPAMHERAREWQRASKGRNKARHDAHASAPELQVGDFALLHQPSHATRPGLSSKLIISWSRPMRVVRQVTPVTYELEDTRTGERTVAHAQRLRKWQASAPDAAAQQASSDEAFTPPRDADLASVPSPSVPAKPQDARQPKVGSMLIARNSQNVAHGFVARVIGPAGQDGVPVHAYNSHASKTPLARRRFAPSYWRWTGDEDFVELFTNKPPLGYEPFELYVDADDIVARDFDLEDGRIPENVVSALPSSFTI